jgi:CheY-like chemotaxis protein
VFLAHDGRDALEQVRRWHPQVVLLDIGLPGMDGFEVAAALRREPGQGSMRVISMSGLSREDDFARALESGVDQHLSKPVELRFLQSLLGPRW